MVLAYIREEQIGNHLEIETYLGSIARRYPPGIGGLYHQGTPLGKRKYVIYEKNSCTEYCSLIAPPDRGTYISFRKI
jgi:hypothetical protein